FASRLATGEIAAALFAGRIVMAVYETIVLTAGVLVFPRIARFVQQRDEHAVGRAVTDALHWLVPVTVAGMVLLAVSRTDLVTLIYRRRAFDERATVLVSQALLGYAPYVVATTLVEILHRAMVLRGRAAGYLLVFGGGLLVNWLACVWLVPALGVLGVTLSAAIGVVAAGAGLWTYAHRRLPALELQRVVLLVGRTLAAAAVVFAVLTPVRDRIPLPASVAGRLLRLLGDAGARVVYCAARVLTVRQWAAIPRLLRRIRPDLYHYPHFDLPAVPVPSVVTIYDLNPALLPGYFTRQPTLRRWVAHRLV